MIRFNRSLIAGVIIGLLFMPCTVGAQTVKDVFVANPSTNPVPVVVQDGNGQPFEFSGTFRNPAGTFPGCITPHDVFTVPFGETFVVTDILLTGFLGNFLVTIQRDAVDIFGTRVGAACTGCAPTFDHAFQTGLRFGENETLRLTNKTSCTDAEVGFLITGIRTPS